MVKSLTYADGNRNCKCRCEEEFLKQISCPYAQHIITFQEVPWFPSGTKVMPCHSYYCHSKFGCIMNKEKNDMKKIDKLPRFMPGQVIDLSYKHGLPNRILIKTVYTREQDKGWMYAVYLESTDTKAALSEDFIVSNMTTKSARVYKSPDVIKLYSSGWRFCGNFNKDKAYIVAGKYATNKYIKDIILRPALDAKGYIIDAYGMWIRYNNTINDDGTIVSNVENDDVIVIK